MNNQPRNTYSLDSNFLYISAYNNNYDTQKNHQETELIYVINGNLNVNVLDRQYHLNRSDFIVINSNDQHAIQYEDETIFLSIYLHNQHMKDLLGVGNVLFTCNSVIQRQSSDDELRKIIEDLLALHLKGNKISKAEMIKKGLKLVLTLSKKYSNLPNENSSVKQDKRLSDILLFIQQNFRDSLSLNEVANAHYISVPYLSKYFKKQTGKTFLQYLNEIRLSHAVNELLTTEKTITRIALDNGFPNLVAFNRVFMEHYHEKPIIYRKKYGMKEVYIEESEKIKDPLYNQKYILVNNSKISDVNKNWNKLINIGYAKDILNPDMQEHLIGLQSELGFVYGRIWGLLQDEMLIDESDEKKVAYNFSNTNKILDFLIANKLTPFIDIGLKPKVVTEKIIVLRRVNIRPVNDWIKLIRAFLLNCVERYGMEEVERWYFELWNKDLVPSKTGKVSDCEDFLSDRYFKMFEEIKRTINDLVPSAKLGGCGLTLDLEENELHAFLDRWSKQKVKPDFLSLYLFPTEPKRGKGGLPIKNFQSDDPDYVERKIKLARKIISKTDFRDLEINVTEWNITISNREYVNDSCFKSSYIVRNIIQNADSHVNMIGYWLFSDIYSSFKDTRNILHGGTGLVSKNGIKKPGYYAYVFLEQLGTDLIAKGENYIITKKCGERFQIVCFNYKHFNSAYYLHPEGSTEIHEQYNIFEDSLQKVFSIELRGMRNGNYRIKEQRLNREHGSIMDEWLKFGAAEDIKLDEIEYLKKISVPYMKVEHTLVKENSIKLDINLEPHEVRLIELNLHYDN